MINVEMEFHSPELFADVDDGVRQLPDGCTVKEAIDKLLVDEPSFNTENYSDLVIFLIDGAPAKLDSVLKDGNKLFVLRKSFGG